MALYMVRVVLSDVHIWRDFDFGLLRSFIRYSAPLGISSLGIFAINYGDRFFLQRNVSMTELGLYSLAYKIGMLITYIQMPFDVYWRSQVFSIVRTPDGEKIYVRVCTYLTLALTGVVLLMFLFARPILHVMAAPAFEGAALYVPWIALAYVIRTVGGHFRCAFLLEGKTMKDFGVTTAGAMACVAGYALLIPTLKVWGAIASTVLGFAVMFVLGLWQAQRLRYFPFEYRRMAQLAALALVIGLTFAFFKPASLWMHAGVAVLFAGAYPLLLILVPFLYHEEVQAVRQALTMAGRRFGFGPLAGQRASQ
jgi:O-antigen/teichoic acid export membrane protein